MHLSSSRIPSSRSFAKSRHRLLESLESRLLLSTFTPTQIRHAYGFDQLSADGTGQTIALVEAFNDSHIATDLAKFDQTYGIPGSNFLTIQAFGSRSDAGWAMETALDAEWAHAIAPGAKILIVEANSSSISDLMTAVDYARNYTGVTVVSMSWGAGEFSSETAYDSYFTTPTGHAPISFFASSGDNGAGTSWPSVSPNVVSVGGTSLFLGSDGSYTSESAWNGSGGGISTYESKPSYQSTVNQSTTKRTNPDVAYDADPNTGFMVYDSNYNGSSGWWSVGGTSAGAPQWAALVALADQVRGSGLTPLPSLTTSQVLKTNYAATSGFHDITSGSNGFAAAAGYDLATGIGSPFANAVIASLAATSVPTSPGDFSAPPSGGGGSGNGHGKNHIHIIRGNDDAVPVLLKAADDVGTPESSPAPHITISLVSLPAIAASVSASPAILTFAGTSFTVASLPAADEGLLAPAPASAPADAGDAAGSVAIVGDTVEQTPSVTSVPVDSIIISDEPVAQPAPVTLDAPTTVDSPQAAAPQASAAIAPARLGLPMISRWYYAAVGLPILAWSTLSRKTRREEGRD